MKKVLFYSFLFTFACCGQEKIEFLFLNFRTYSSSQEVRFLYKEAIFVEGEEGLSIISLNHYKLDGFYVDLTLLFNNNKLGAVLVDVQNENVVEFESRYVSIPATNTVVYEKTFGGCTKSSDIIEPEAITCFKWVNRNLMFEYFQNE